MSKSRNAARLETAPTEGTAGLFDHLEGEQWLLRRLLKHGVDALAGVVDSAADRRARMRAAILDNGLAVVIAGGSKEGKSVNYAQAFERLYSEPLVLKPTRKGKPTC